MSVRHHAIVAALATLLLPAAFAAQPTAVFIGGEAGWVDGAAPAPQSATQVRNEYLRFRADPVGADGGRYVGGEEGYKFPAHSYALRNGRLVCTDNIAHNPKPAAIKSPAEEQQFQQQYPA